ncbi:MAG: hypothetical protein FD167_2943 [bacterium]|nr:MAG: hypothetical protein FD167_2943 [bacterium]
MFINSYSTLKKKATFLFTALVLLICFAKNSYGQGTFQSGSTGADGAFNPTTNQTITLPTNGVFNFTTITIPAGITITFTKNASNTPVTMLATGDVLIQGTINLAGQNGQTSGLGGQGAAGGFNGGNGGFPAPGLLNGLNGSGPGGGEGGRNQNTVAGSGGSAGYATAGVANGNAPNGAAGNAYGNGLLIPLIGGSGGGGNASNGTSVGTSGGAGGGAILIASSTSITLASTSTITVTGGNQGSGGASAGSGGAIKLVANTISGNGILRAEPGKNGSGFPLGSQGFIRVEAFTLTSFTPSIPQFSPQPILGLPNPIEIPNAPQLKIVSVAGVLAPTNPVGSLAGAADITLPATQPNPVTVVLEAVNVPTGVFADVRLTPSTGAISTIISSAFAPTGTPATTSGTAQVSLPLGISLITASLTVDLTQAKAEPIFMDGEKVDRIEITAVFGGQSQTTYITSSGKKIIQ